MCILSCWKRDFVQEPDDYLYVILPFFNYCGFQRRTQLFIEFVQRIHVQPNIRIVISEATKSKEPYQLPASISGVYLHLRNEVEHYMWIKENLINVAARMLPTTWKYMAWIDADITFMNENWVADTVRALQTCDVIQLFHTCVNMGPMGESMKIEPSFMYMYKESGRPYHPQSKYGLWHPGFAHACTRKAFVQMGGLVDFGILGSGDRHMVLALIGLVHLSHPGNIHENYKKNLLAYQDRVKGLTVGYVHGTILHHWHGRIADRKYKERWDIIVKGSYDPNTDIDHDRNGLIHFTPNGKRLEPFIQDYFIGRQEDNDKI